MNSRYVIDRDRGWNRIKGALQGKKSAALIGILADDDDRSDDDTWGNAAIAAFHEFGTGEVPQRSFLRAVVDANRARYKQQLRQGLQHVIKGGATVDGVLEQLAETVKKDVQDRLEALGLVETGQLKDAIDHRTEGLL